jgi:hypothetical protein
MRKGWLNGLVSRAVVLASSYSSDITLFRINVKQIFRIDLWEFGDSGRNESTFEHELNQAARGNETLSYNFEESLLDVEDRDL